MNHTEVFFYEKSFLFVEIKYKAVEESRIFNKRNYEKLNIRNRTQVKTWWRWYRNGESYRFSQQVGKQYTYVKVRRAVRSEQLKLEKRKDIELDILKRQGIGKEVVPTVSVCGSIKVKYSIKLILEVLNIPKSTYYRWKNKTHKMMP